MRVPSTKVQNNFGKYLKYVEVNEEVIVTKKGKNVARKLPCNDAEKSLVEEGTAGAVLRAPACGQRDSRYLL